MNSTVTSPLNSTKTSNAGSDDANTQSQENQRHYIFAALGSMAGGVFLWAFRKPLLERFSKWNCVRKNSEDDSKFAQRMERSRVTISHNLDEIMDDLISLKDSDSGSQYSDGTMWEGMEGFLEEKSSEKSFQRNTNHDLESDFSNDSVWNGMEEFLEEDLCEKNIGVRINPDQQWQHQEQWQQYPKDSQYSHNEE